MESVYQQSTYFTLRQKLREREQELHTALKDRLLGNEIAAALFEYLAVRREGLKEKELKESVEGSHVLRGRIAELRDLLELFERK